MASLRARQCDCRALGRSPRPVPENAPDVILYSKESGSKGVIPDGAIGSADTPVLLNSLDRKKNLVEIK